ncbi:hypothetical protein HYDPIDRAFT_117694 [Hydnomerulius pinastri MD-312]|uniref:Uncharacterized protein n=1 Tax=Hydnomerulius pinastri MD-312 TaxID=994086 RepID=A0A0C9VQL5_9AGAM|nr:hypothetical protein HYDPIDRAFT_117694 [Hydnomerulius pinastri MD-312]
MPQVTGMLSLGSPSLFLADTLLGHSLARLLLLGSVYFNRLFNVSLKSQSHCGSLLA